MISLPCFFGGKYLLVWVSDVSFHSSVTCTIVPKQSVRGEKDQPAARERGRRDQSFRSKQLQLKTKQQTKSKTSKYKTKQKQTNQPCQKWFPWKTDDQYSESQFIIFLFCFSFHVSEIFAKNFENVVKFQPKGKQPNKDQRNKNDEEKLKRLTSRRQNYFSFV